MTQIEDGPFTGLDRHGFACILCDPPWFFTAYDGRGGLATNARKWGLAAVHYEVTTTDELKKLPVAELAAKDCALFMWVVDANLPEALELGAAWGFNYKTIAFNWVKSREGYSPWPSLGYWTRKGAEMCLLFTKGSPKRLSKDVEQVVFCPRGAHSAKPEIVYERVEKLVGGPRLELFARHSRPGWAGWGSQYGIRDGLFSDSPESPPVAR